MSALEHKRPRGRLVAAEQAKVIAAQFFEARDATDVAGRLFNATDTRMAGQAARGFRQQIHGGPPRNVVEQNRFVHGFGNGLEMTD